MTYTTWPLSTAFSPRTCALPPACIFHAFCFLPRWMSETRRSEFAYHPTVIMGRVHSSLHRSICILFYHDLLIQQFVASTLFESPDWSLVSVAINTMCDRNTRTYTRKVRASVISQVFTPRDDPLTCGDFDSQYKYHVHEAHWN